MAQETLKITAADVNKLRQKTGAGMMDCKKALVEAEGDFEKAIEILRKKGQKVAAKRGEKEASEGLAVATVSEDGSKGIIAMINCETDFVAKNEEFNRFVSAIADIALKNTPASIDELKQLPYNDSGMTVNDKIYEEIGKIGEKVELAAYEKIEAETVIAYNHPGNQVASLVGLNKKGDKVTEAGKDVAMQVAAMHPIALNKEDVSPEIIEKEIEIGKEQARAEGKPEQILEKIALGKLNKFYQENTLLNQAFIKDNKKTVAQYLKDVDPELTVIDFKRFSIAE